MKNTKTVGDIAELGAMLCFMVKGHSVSKPFGDNQKYDFIAEYRNKLQRIQCKSAKIKGGALIASSGRIVKRNDRFIRENYTKDEIDLFAIYSPELHRCFVVDVKDAAKSAITLRIDAPKKGGKQKRIRWAKDYEIEEA